MTKESISSELNSLYRYIYTVLREYPAPNIIILRFDDEVVRNNSISSFYQSCASILKVKQGTFIYSLSQPVDLENANLAITNSDLEYLYSHNFIPKIDNSTLV